MKDTILTNLEELESRLGITILFASETGSRAWGFASPDSDYDVRIIYTHQLDWYLSVNERKDSCSAMLDDGLIDITGWELRKCLRLLSKSNMAVLERLNSPTVYKADTDFRDRLHAVASSFYNPIAASYHYSGIAKTALAAIASSPTSYRLKKLFYALRAGAACQWIYENHPGPPPIVFDEMVSQLTIEDATVSKIAALKQRKINEPESYEHSGEADLLQLIEDQIRLAEKSAQTMTFTKPSNQLLDALMRSTIC